MNSFRSRLRRASLPTSGSLKLNHPRPHVSLHSLVGGESSNEHHSSDNAASQNEEWVRVQDAIIAIFQQKPVSQMEMTTICLRMKELVDTDIGPFMYDFYKNQLLTTGMVQLFNSIPSDTDDLLAALSVIWDRFYRNILPQLQVILLPIKIKQPDVRHVTLLGFRDKLLSSTNIEDVLSQVKKGVPPFLTQMLLVLQSVRDRTPPDDNLFRIEQLTGSVLSSYLGYRGLYRNGELEPTYYKTKHKGREPDESREEFLLKPPGCCSFRRPLQNVRQVSSPMLLETLQEYVPADDKERRHSTSNILV